MGKILLTLRRPDEKDELAGEDLTPIAEILSGKSKSGSENGDSGQGSGFLQIVKDGGNTTPAHTSTADAEWKMIIMTPAERKEFSWADKNGLPSEASQTNVGTTAPASSGSSSAPTSRGAPEGASLDEPETDHKAVPGGLDKDPSKVKPGKPSA